MAWARYLTGPQGALDLKFGVQAVVPSYGSEFELNII